MNGRPFDKLRANDRSGIGKYAALGIVVIPSLTIYNCQMDIEDIIRAIREGRVHITDHAQNEAEEDQLSYDDISASVYQGEVIEDYPDDRPFPSCLIYGNTYSQEPVHSVWAYNKEGGRAILITVYRPDPARWIHWRVRRPR